MIPATETATIPAFEQTKLFAITSEAETQTSSYPANDATITAIMARKYFEGTAMAATMTAQPSETPTPTIPPGSPFCHPGDLQTTFASQGATQNILLSAGLTNISGTPCFLQAWPQVELVDRSGNPLAVNYYYFNIGPEVATLSPTQLAQDSTTGIGIWSGWEAQLNLVWSNWCGAPVPGGVVIRLTLGNNAGDVLVLTDVQSGGVCNAPGEGSSVGISNIETILPFP